MPQTKSARFGLCGFDDIGKEQDVRGFDALTLIVDWDDVDHVKTAYELKKMCEILNAHWEDDQHKQIPIGKHKEEEESDFYDMEYENAKETMRKLAE